MLKETLLKFFKLDGLINNVTGYIEARMELVKHELKEDLVGTISGLAAITIFSLFLFLFMLFISISVAFMISESMGLYTGFAIVAGFYFILVVCLLIFKQPISTKIEKEIRKIIISKDDEHGD